MEQISDIFIKEWTASRCGCYLKNPGAAGLSTQSTFVPLRHIDYHLQIVNSLLNITLTQTYLNPIDKYLEVEYSVPINPHCSIYKFIAQFNDVKIQGIVKEKGEARKDFEKAKSEGRQAAMGSINSDSPNILNLQIGNIPPKTQFIITISLLQEIKISLNTFYRVLIPAAISPNYMNKPKSETLTTTKTKQHQKFKGKDVSWNFKIDLKTSRKVIFFDSPSHDLTLLNQNQNGTETLLIMGQSETPNKDFIFTYTTEDFHLPSYVLGSTDISATVMVSFIPKFCNMDVTDAYKAFIQNRSYQIDISTVKGDYVFFLDRSHSMGGKRMAKAKEALIFFLKSLPEDSYFNVISFGGTATRMFPKSQKNNSSIIRDAIDQIQEMKANMGGTWIYTSLFELLRQRVNDGYPRQVFLLTDGGVENTQQVINMVSMNTNYSRVHTIGIGDRVSYNLIQGCAEAGKGKYTIIADNENPANKIIKLLEDSLSPLISNVQLNCNEGEQIESIIPNPKQFPYILKDEPVNLFITFNGPITDRKSFCVEYQDYFTKLPYKCSIQVDTFANNLPFVDRMAHLKVLKFLELSAENSMLPESLMFYSRASKNVQQVIEYSIKHQVLSKYTSFICVGNQLADHDYQKYKSVGSQKSIVQNKSSLKKSRTKARASKQPSSSLKKCKKSMPTITSPPTFLPHTAPSYLIQPMTSNYSSSNHFSQQQCMPMNSFFHMSKKTLPVGFSQDVNECNQNYSENEDQSEMQEEGRPRKRVKLSQQSKEKFSIKKSKEKKKKIKTGCESQNSDIEKIVFEQEANGSWANIKLIEQVGKNIEFILGLVETINVAIVVTKVVVLWLQKHHTEWQYQLIIRKAIAWLAKASLSKSDQEKLDRIECK